MKRLLILCSILFFSLSTFAQKSEVGIINTSDGGEITMYKRTKKKVNTSRMKKGCDCQMTIKNTFLYSNKEGKIKKINQADIAKVRMEKGTVLCQESRTGVPGGTSFDNNMAYELPGPIEYLGLQIKKKSKFKALHTTLFKSADYMLTMYQESDLDYRIYIFTTDKHEYVAGRYKYFEVGYGKDGKKALNELKKYFKDCTAFIDGLEETLANNEKVKRRHRIPLLQGLKSNECK